MAMMQTHQICAGITLPADATEYYYPVTDSEGVTNVGPFDQVTFIVQAASTGAINTVLGLQVSPDGTNWYRAFVHPLAAAANKWTLAETVNIVATTANALFALSNSVPYIRLTAQNNAADALALTVWAIVTRT